MTNTLINLTGVRAAIKRAFNGSVYEIVAELLQNSQRAKSKLVKIATKAETVFRYKDDGHGIVNEADLIALIKIGETGWDEKVQADQHPMGLGLHALLAHEGVSEVTIESGGRKVVIDTKRWWADHEYAAGWLNRVTESKRQRGFKLSAKVSQKFNQEASELFVHAWGANTNNLAVGYAEHMIVLHNARRVNPKFDPTNSFDMFLLETEIMGNRCFIGYLPKSLKPTGVNWYGQVISLDPSISKSRYDSFGVFYDVREGCPLDAKSPTRSGFIQNAKLAAFNGAINQALEHYFETTPMAEIPVAALNSFLNINSDYRSRSQYFTASKVDELDPEMASSVDEVDKGGARQIFRYSEAPTLIEEQIEVTLDEKPFTYEKGISSFVAMIGEVYTLDAGDTKRLTIKQLHWKTAAAKTKISQIVEPGEYALAATEDEPTEQHSALSTQHSALSAWHPVTVPVIAIQEANNWDVNDAEFLFAGLAPKEFLKSNYAWMPFDPSNEDHDYETIEAAYTKSIQETMRRVVGNAIPQDFSYSDLRSAVGYKNDILAIKVIKADRGYYPEAVHVKYVDKENAEHEIELVTIG